MSDDNTNHVLDELLNDYIDKLHFRTFGRIWNKVHQQFPDVAKQHLRDVLERRLSDPRDIPKKQARFMNKVFSSHLNAWIMDILDNTKQRDDEEEERQREPRQRSDKDSFPRFYMIFIHTNSRFGVAFPIDSKSADSVKSAIIKLRQKYKVASLTGDDEKAYTSKDVMKYLTDHHITLKINIEQQHGGMSILDRFIRTLRDMNTPTMKTKKQSHHSKYKAFSLHRMKKLLNIYNSTKHSAIGMTPEEMLNDKNKEIKYITECLIKREQQKEDKAYQIENDEYARYVLEKKAMKKRRYHVSPECYKVVGHEGQLFVLEAADGTTKLVPRWRILKLGKNKPSNVKFAETFPDSGKGSIETLVSYNPHNKSYDVKFEGSDKVYTVHSKDLRGRFPQILSDMEREFRQRNRLSMSD